MTVNNFAFTPADGLRNAVSFPTTPASEADARDQVQDISDQIRDYINTTIVAAINAKLDLTGGNLTGALASNDTLTGTALIAAGLTGATAASRYVGATTSGAPTSGAFAKGDFVIGQAGAIWVCGTAGTPGTWTKVGGGAASVVSGTYTGDNTSGRLISVGNVPKLVWVNWEDGTNHSVSFGFPETTAGNSVGIGSFYPSSTITPNGDGGTGSSADYVPRIRAAQNGFLVGFGGGGGTVGATNYTGITYKWWALV